MFPQLLFQTLTLARKSPNLPLPSASLHTHWPPLFQENQVPDAAFAFSACIFNVVHLAAGPPSLLSSLKRWEALPSAQGHSFCSELVFFFLLCVPSSSEEAPLPLRNHPLSFFVHMVELALTPPQFQRGQVTNLEPLKTLQLFGHRNRSE